MNKQVLKMNQKMKLLVTISSNQELLTRLTVTGSYVSTVTRRYVSTVTGRYIST